MRRFLSVLTAAVFCVFVVMPAGAAKAPTQLAGITLGANAEDLRDRMDLSRMAPLWDKPWLIRVNLKPTKGFAAGYVILGGCATANRVERVRLQYADSSKALYEKLSKALTARYGLPTMLKGPRGVKYMGRRWVFGTSKGKGTDILLEHFDKGGEDTPVGNVIRLTDNRAMAQERMCHETMIKGAPEPQPAFPLFEIDDNWLLPQ